MAKVEPGYEQIKRWIMTQIQSRALSEGDPLPSENELAARFHVNRNHSRRALRELEVEGYALRSQGRRSLVAPGRQQVHTMPNLGSGVVSLVIPVYQTLLTRTIVDGFMSEVAARDGQTIVYNIQMSEAAEVDFLRQAPDRGVEGLAIWLQNDTQDLRQAMDHLCERGFPVLQFDRCLEGTKADYVVTDNLALGHRLTSALLERGHKIVGFLTDLERVSSAENRLRGYRQAMEEAHRVCPAHFVARVAPLDTEAARAAIGAIMAYRNPPTAFVCIHDHLAKTLAQELQRLGYAVPDDVEIATVDDEHFAQSLDVPLITLSQPGYEIGRQSAQVLLARVADPMRPPDQRRLAFVAP